MLPDALPNTLPDALANSLPNTPLKKDAATATPSSIATPTPVISEPEVTDWTEVAEIGNARAHESAHLHVAGSANFTDDIPELQGTLHAALGLSQKAHAEILGLDLTSVLASEGVTAAFTAKDFPGANECGPIIHDDPILADGLVQYIGQPIFVVVAHSHDLARRAARKARITYRELPPILTPQAARAANALVIPALRLQKGDPQATITSAPHRLTGKLQVGGQEQFYLEGQIAYAIPKEDQSMFVYSSTQHPSEMQHVVAHALGLTAHKVVVECRRMGGGFGGKESQSALWAGTAALCAYHLQRPVKLRADRDDDMIVTGKRHEFYYEYEVGYDDLGMLLGARLQMVLRAGFSADLSGPVATRAICHFDNAYYLSDVDIQALCGKTNTQSNTAFRGFGGPQGAIAIENILDDIARNLGLDPLTVRKRNFYGRSIKDGRNSTPYGQFVADNVIHEIVEQLEVSSEYHKRRGRISAFNSTSPVLKKGIALTPLKFGIAFNVTHLNQAGALVHVYTDGSVLVNHGGTEMGQGVNTKIAQVVAHELGISFSKVKVTAADTSKIANTSATAASTGTDLNGKAAQDAARQIRERLANFVANRLKLKADDVTFFSDVCYFQEQSLPFVEVVKQAYLARVQLWSDGFYATPGLSWDAKTMRGSPFAYFAYGAAVSEVIVDTLTGEWKCLRVDALYDAGKSLNPAIDIGQIEGAFIQGMGWLTTEELVWNAAGKLTTHAPSTYKIPAISDCPSDFRVALFNNPKLPESIHQSKAVGEPPLLLPFSVFFAIRDAISSLAAHRRSPPLQAPATPEAILRAIEAMQE